MTPTTNVNDEDEELEALYQSVLQAYTAPAPQPQFQPLRASRASSSSSRAVRPLPPTPGGSVGRPPIPPTGTPAQSLHSLPISRPGSSASRHHPLPHYHPEDAGPSNSNGVVSPDRTPQMQPLDIEVPVPVDDGPPASTLDSTGTGSTRPWSEFHNSEYTDPDTIPALPKYIPKLEDDPYASNTHPVIPTEDSYGEYDYSEAYHNSMSMDGALPNQYSADEPPYEQSEDQSYYDAPERLPHEDEERPPYEPDPSYPYDRPYDSYYETNPSQMSPSVNDEEESGTMISASGYEILRPPQQRASADSYASTDLPYMANSPQDSVGPSSTSYVLSAAASSSWQGYSEVETPQPPPPPRPPPEPDYRDWNVAGPSDLRRRVTRIANDFAAMRNFDPRTVIDTYRHDDDFADDGLEDPSLFINLALLSHIAVQLQLKVPRGTHVKGSVPYPRAFTGKDIVTTIHSILEQKLVTNHGCSRTDRRPALQVARSLQKQLFFAEVEWGSRTLQDGVEDVYMFLDDEETASFGERAELPSGVATMLTGCYSVTCGEGGPCYSGSCPLKGMNKFLPRVMDSDPDDIKEDWTKAVPPQVLRELPEFEINRQTIIHKLISKEEQYVRDLDIVEQVFIEPLRRSPVIPLYMVDDFIDEVFGNIRDLRDCNRRLLEVMYVRQREEAPIIKTIGDIFLDIATQFRKLYPLYVGKQFFASKRLRDELENNAEFRLFIEQCERQLNGSSSEHHRRDLWHFLNRPTEHLQKYPVLLQAVYQETARDNPDGDFLLESISAIKNLQNVAQLRTFQASMGKGVPGKWEWHDLLTPQMRKRFTKDESQRQSLIFGLIKEEMAYVKDLEVIESVFRRQLLDEEPPVIPIDRADQFETDVFHNIKDLVDHHRRLVDKLHEIQLEEHPRINTITAAIFDAALNFRDAYVEYIPNHPIAAYRIDYEMEHNPDFRRFMEDASRHPDAHRMDLKSFIQLPIPRLQRYELLLKEILSQTPVTHEDSFSIPEVIELIKSLGREVQPGVESAKQKVEIWRYNASLRFKTGDAVDMDLLNEHRALVHTGKLLIQEDGQWIDLFVMLFDNYLVWTKPEERDGVTKYQVIRRPIPLDLLHPVSFNDVTIIRNPSRLRTVNNTGRIDESRNVYPFTLHHTGRQGSNITLSAESLQIRAEWKSKFEEALGLRKVIADSNKVFEIETLSNETFLVPPITLGPTAPTIMYDGMVFTGRVTCSVPFKTAGNRGLVAIGCGEGVWIGFRQDPKSMRRVLHVKNVTQCAVLEDFGLFLVLADKNLFAYHIEALVPNPLNPQPYTSQTPQKINGSRDVQFFSVGTQHGRTLVIYMNRKGSDSVFHVVEPVIDKITEMPKAQSTSLIPIFSSKNKKTDWFRNYQDFIVPGESYDMIFLKAKVSVLCAKGFEIVDLTDFKTVTIPQKDNPALGPAAKRCETCRPMGMFRSSEDEFLLCYNEFGIYVDKHGAPSRSSGAIEWEGTAERVALHAPYILIFDTRFIEIRHMDTCRLSQIIPGNDLHCIWDGRGTDISHAAIPADASEDTVIQEPRVHAVMSETSAQPGGRGIRGISQHVFQLVPTIPLYLPGSLTSPSSNLYYS